MACLDGDGRTTRWRRGSGARRLKALVFALSLAYRDPRVPWHARAVAAGVVAYAFSPIDPIPDPIPILGYLDDLVLIPPGVALAVRLIPAPLWAECQARAEPVRSQGTPTNWLTAGLIVTVWIVLASLAAATVARWAGS